MPAFHRTNLIQFLVVVVLAVFVGGSPTVVVNDAETPKDAEVPNGRTLRIVRDIYDTIYDDSCWTGRRTTGTNTGMSYYIIKGGLKGNLKSLK